MTPQPDWGGATCIKCGFSTTEEMLQAVLCGKCQEEERMRKAHDKNQSQKTSALHQLRPRIDLPPLRPQHVARAAQGGIARLDKDAGDHFALESIHGRT